MDPRQEARSLMSDGIHSTASRQKDDSITKLGNLLIEQINQTEIHKADSERFSAQLSVSEIAVDKLNRQIEKDHKNNARIAQLRHLKSMQTDEKFVSEIKTIESDVAKYLHLSEPWLLQEIMNGPEDDRLEALVNLKFRRLEDLVFGLRRQLIQDQDVMAMLPHITQHFGSVRNLVKEYDESQETIRKLKVRELKISGDELAKRRPLASCGATTIHTLVVALQNEVAETKSQLRSAMQISGRSVSPDALDTMSEAPLDFDMVSEYNVMEANYRELQKKNEDLVKDNAFLKDQLNLEAEVLRVGMFKVYENLKGKLTETDERVVQYGKEVARMQGTIDLQQKLVNQFQKEKAAVMRQKMKIAAEVEIMKKKVEDAEVESRTSKRSVAAMRGLARIMAETTLAKSSEYERTFEDAEALFFNSYERCDSAALIIQRAWRKVKNTVEEKEIVRRSPTCKLAISELMAVSAVDVIAGHMKPVSYRQIVKLLRSYTSEIRNMVQVPLSVMKTHICDTHESTNDLCQSLLCRGKRFAWVQTEPERSDCEVQTERIVPTRGKK